MCATEINDIFAVVLTQWTSHSLPCPLYSLAIKQFIRLFFVPARENLKTFDISVQSVK